MTDIWKPSTVQPPSAQVTVAMEFLAEVLSVQQANAAGDRDMRLPEICEAIIAKGGSQSSAEWAVFECANLGLVRVGQIESEGPGRQLTRSSSEAKPTRLKHILVTSTENLWRIWREGFNDKGTLAENTEAGRIVDIGIIVPLREEFRVFRELLKEMAFPIEDRMLAGRYYPFAVNAGPYRCAATICGAPGEVRAARVASRMVRDLNPSCIVVVGIAAGIHQDIRLGDVVVANSVFSFLQDSKIVDDGTALGFQLSGATYATNHFLSERFEHAEFAEAVAFQQWVEQGASHVVRDAEIFRQALDDASLRSSPEMHCGHVGSSSSVIVSKNMLQNLRSVDRKLLALEMESGAVLSEIHESTPQTKVAVLRGISDFGDERKKTLDAMGEGGIRRLAMANATRLLFMALERKVFSPPTDVGPVTTATIRDTTDAGPTTPRSDEAIYGFSSSTVALRVNSISGFIGRLKDHFECDWEPGSFEDTNPIVYWPVTLRRPTPIHAMQTFVAAGLERMGAQVVLCLDDLGSKVHTSAAFFKTIERWRERVAPSSKFELRLFSELLDGDKEPFDAWPKMRKWLGSEERLLQVLEVAKILPAKTASGDLFDTLQPKRPRRLLTPAVVWTGLAKVQEWFAGRAVITLGGLDERPLWAAWRRVMAEDGAAIGHLYIPQLGGKSAGSEPIHMENVNLGWDSRSDIKATLEADVTLGAEEALTASDRIIPWCIRGCISLPDFVSTDCASLRRYERDGEDNLSRILDAVVRALDDRLLT